MLSDLRRNLRRKRILWTVISVVAALLLCVGVYFLPPVHDRLAWRLEALRTQVKFFFNPPEENVFVPTQQALVTTTPPATKTPTPTPLPDEPTITPTITPTSIPDAVKLIDITYVNQCNRWNYCGPANLTMALNYWGWEGDRDDVAMVIKPGENDTNKDFISRGETDVNIMPYEMVDFVNYETDLRALYRYGGEPDLLRRMVAAGFPVIIEKGYYQHDTTGRVSWMGHFSFVTGYDDEQELFVWQDSYPDACADKENYYIVERKGSDQLISYTDLANAWRGFNYVFIVIYPREREAEVMTVLGPWADWDWAANHALEMAVEEIPTQSGNDLFFAWFNKGTSLVALQQYAEAGAAFDQAFLLYAGLGDDDAKRPYRIAWYQTGPFWAYHYSGRYQDVINLAGNNFETISPPKTLEESFYWRALAEYALGQYDAAYEDLRQAVYYNKNFQAALAVMDQWGITP